MKSRISFFNPGVSRNLLRRCWPLWAGYTILLLFVLPVSMARMPDWYGRQAVEYLTRTALDSARLMIFLSFFMGILTAMVMFGYLYHSRSCGMMTSLPLRRETMFLTAWLTGFVPMLLADLLTALITAVFYLGRGLSLLALLQWLAAAVGTNLAFYGFAVFCAMLTGSLLILPVVYLVLNLAAWVAESCLRQLLDVLVYGLVSDRLYLLWLSPLAKLEKSVYLGTWDGNHWQLCGLGWVLFYALCGLTLSALALLLYRRRQMETASDTVAIPVLKPIFRYCMALGTALVCSSVIYSILLGGAFHGGTAALLILALLLLGAVLGWYAAEMLIRKTVRVFPGPWKGLAAVCAALALFVCVAEFDLLGYERRVPDPEEIRSVDLQMGRAQALTEADSIEKAVALHQSLVDHKAQHEPDIHVYGQRVNLSYELKDGSTLERSYYLASWDSGTVDDPTDLLLWQELLNCPELRRQLSAVYLPVTEQTVYSAQFTCVKTDDEDREQYETLSLTPAEAVDFYESCVLPDLEQGTLGRWWKVHDEQYRNTVSNVNFYMELRRVWADPVTGLMQEDWDSLDLDICMDSENCLRWLQEHSDLSVGSLGETETDMTHPDVPAARPR